MADHFPRGATYDTEGDSKLMADSPFHGDLAVQQVAWEDTPSEHVLLDEQSNVGASLEYQAEESIASNDYSAFIPPCLNHAAKFDESDDQASEHAYSDDQVYEDDDPRQSNAMLDCRRVRQTMSLEAQVTKTHKENHESRTSGGHSLEDSWSVIGARLALEQKERDGAVSEPSKFVDPLPEISIVESNDFLSRFLFKLRKVDIHPERKHKLSRFLLRMCEEASFAHVSLHAPSMLSLLRISTPDEIELRCWIEIIDNLRDKKKIPAGRTFDNETPGDKCGVLMMRHIATHRMDYDSKLIEYVVWFLEKLDDHSRRQQVEEALEQVYYDERATALRGEAEITAIDLQGWETVLWGASAYVDLIAANKSPRSRNDSADSNQTLIASAKWAEFKQVPEPRDYDEVNLYAGFWACHLMDEKIEDAPKDWDAPADEESTLRFYKNAQDLMVLVGDQDAERKIRLATWVADRNLSVSARNKGDVEGARSLREREEMLIEVKRWQRSLGLDGKGWLYERLDDSINYFRKQVEEAERGYWGEDWYSIENIFSRWGE
ncbi:MAG: hypothetical protein Q9213_001563 [Squamulea squamosa]